MNPLFVNNELLTEMLSYQYTHTKFMMMTTVFFNTRGGKQH